MAGKVMLHVSDAIKKESDKAILARMWSHTIGIVNQKCTVGKLPDGRRGNEERPGTGSVIRWGQHHCILTAKHVIEDADKGDLRFFFRTTGTLDSVPREDFERQNYTEYHPGWSAEIYNIFRCDWEDMAVLTVNPEPRYLNTEFFDFESAWGDPPVGSWFGSAGFPTHEPAHLRTIREGTNEEHIFGLALTPWDGIVIDPGSLIESRFQDIPFDTRRHFLARWNPTDPTMGMKGFSGAPVWTEAPTAKGQAWSAKLVFAGMCTHYYSRPDQLARMIKASVVRRFLEEALPRAEGAGPTAR